MLASQRARSLSSGTELTVERDNDKNPVVALREIAESKIDLEEVKDLLVVGLQKHVISDEPDEEELPLLSDQEDTEQQASEESATEPQIGFSSKNTRLPKTSQAVSLISSLNWKCSTDNDVFPGTFLSQPQVETDRESL